MAFSGGMLFLYARLVPMGQGSEPSEQFKRATFMSLMIAFSAVFAITMTFDMLSFRILCALLGGAALWQKIGYMFLRPFVFQSPPSIGAGRPLARSPMEWDLGPKFLCAYKLGTALEWPPFTLPLFAWLPHLACATTCLAKEAPCMRR